MLNTNWFNFVLHVLILGTQCSLTPHCVDAENLWTNPVRPCWALSNSSPTCLRVGGVFRYCLRCISQHNLTLACVSNIVVLFIDGEGWHRVWMGGNSPSHFSTENGGGGITLVEGIRVSEGSWRCGEFEHCSLNTDTRLIIIINVVSFN